MPAPGAVLGGKPNLGCVNRGLGGEVYETRSSPALGGDVRAEWLMIPGSVPGSRMKRVGGVVDDSRCAPRLDETRGRRTFGGLQIRLRVWGDCD